MKKNEIIEDDLDALLAELEGEIPDSGAAGAPSQTETSEPPIEDKPEPPAVEDEPVEQQETGLEDELMAELGGAVDFGTADEQKPEPSVEDMPELPVEEQFTEPTGAPAGQDELDDLDEVLAAPGEITSGLGTGEESTWPEEGPTEPQPTPPPTPVGKKKGKKPVIIGIVAVLCLCAIGLGAWQMLSHKSPAGDEQASQPTATEPAETESATEPAATETTTEPAAEPAAAQAESADEGVIYDNVDHNLPITSLRMEFDNSKKIGDGIISTDVVFLLSNHTGHDVTGFAFRAYNKDGDKAVIKNRDKNCKSDAPFYAEGYLPDGGNGVMVSEMIISKEDFKKLNPKKDGHRLKPKCIQVSEAYVFRGKTDYNQPTGKLIGPHKDKSNKVNYYSVEIDNDNETPVHEGARIVAMRRDDENSGSIRKRSARGSVDQEIPAGSKGFVIERTFNNSGLERWPAEDYEVYVIDNKYSDGTHYYDSYKAKYGQ